MFVSKKSILCSILLGSALTGLGTQAGFADQLGLINFSHNTLINKINNSDHLNDWIIPQQLNPYGGAKLNWFFQSICDTHGACWTVPGNGFLRYQFNCPAGDVNTIQIEITSTNGGNVSVAYFGNACAQVYIGNQQVKPNTLGVSMNLNPNGKNSPIIIMDNH